MIRISHLRDITRPETVQRREVEWGIGCTPRDLAPQWADPKDPLIGCSRNCGTVTDWDAQLTDGDYVHYWARPGSEKLMNLGALGAFLFAPVGGALWWTSILYGVSKIIAPSRKPVQPGDESSPTYAFTNLQRNTRGEGAPIPVIYGRHRVAPPIINESIRSSIDASGNPSSEYIALYLIGEGPIYAIGDKLIDGGPYSVEAGNALDTIEINNQPAKNFSGVEAHIRLGNNEQTPITEFADPVLEFSVDKTLRESPTLTKATTPNDAPSGTTAIATTGSFLFSDANIAKWDSFESYVSGDEADEFTVGLKFPQGLISYNGVGAALSNSTIYQIRYRQVDGSGTPFGSYVVLPAEQATLTRANDLKLESRHLFYDPSSYIQPLPGFFTRSRAALLANPGLSYTLATYSPAAPTALQFTFMTWIRRRNAQTVGTTNRLFQWYASNQGFRLNIQRSGTAIASLFLEVGTGASTPTVTAAISSTAGPLVSLTTDTVNFHQLVVTYEAKYNGGANSRVRAYIDGVIRGEAITSAQCTLDATQQIRLMSDLAVAPTLGFDGHMDETTFWSRALTAYEVASRYNGGAPLAVDAASLGLIVGARMDTQLGSSPNIGTDAFGPFSTASRWILGSGTNAGTDPECSSQPTSALGLVKTPEGLVKLRGKFLVEVMRLDTEDVANNAFSEVAFDTIQLRTFQQFEYPGMALLAVKIPANDQLSGGAPLVTVRVDGRLVPVWDGVDQVYPNMVPTYSRNPAWIDADALLNTDYGLGSVYTERDLVVGEFQALAAAADTLVYDNLDREALLNANYLDSTEATSFGGVVLGIDCVRYRTVELPSNFVQPTTTASGRFLKPVLTSLTPAAPAWLTAQAALIAQEVLLVEYRSADNSFWTYTRTTQTLGAGQTAYTVSGGSSDSNGLEMHDVRFRYDGVFDRSDFGAWDAVLQILASARAAPVRLGSRVSVFLDDVTNPTSLICMGNIIPGTWQQGFMGVADRPNAESSDFFDESLNWERSPVSDEHPDVNDPAKNSSFRWRRTRLEGITRRGQAKRSLRRDLNAFALIKRWVSFEVGIDEIPSAAGDVSGISHDTPQWGFSGRFFADGTSTTVKLDREIILESGKSYQIQVEDAATNARQTRTVTQAAGTYAPGVAITCTAFTAYIPSMDDKYALGETIRGEVKNMRLVEKTFNPRTLRSKLRYIEYVPAAYLDDFGTLPITGTSALPVPTAPAVPPGVQNLTVGDVTSRGPDGSVRISALVEFSHFAETFASVGGTDVYLSVGGNEIGIGSASHKAHLAAGSTSALIEHSFVRNQKYTFWVLPRTRDGAGAYRSFASWIEFTPSGLAPHPLPPANPRVTVAGEMAVHEWDDDEDLDHGATVEVRQGGWILGVPILSAPAQARHSAPLAAWADSEANDLGVGTPSLYARTKLRTGQYSAAVEYTGDVSVISHGGSALAVSEEDGGFSA